MKGERPDFFIAWVGFWFFPNSDDFLLKKLISGHFAKLLEM